MADPLGLIGGAGGPVQRPHGAARPASQPQDGGPSFKDVLIRNLEQVNELQQDADKAVEDLVTGRRDDVEGVILATQKADTAFKMLQSMRNKVMAAYDEIKQMRV